MSQDHSVAHLTDSLFSQKTTMNQNISGQRHPTSNSSTFVPPRQAQQHSGPHRVEFDEFDLPDTTENNLLNCPVTRRWRPAWHYSKDTDEDNENDSEADSENSEIAFRSNDEGQASGSNNSHPNQSEDFHPPSRATNMAGHSHKKAEQAKPTPTSPSPSQPPASFSPSDNSRVSQVSHMTPEPRRTMQPQASPLSRGSAKEASGNRLRVTESIRNGKRRVEIDLLSDDEDDAASPSQHASDSVRQRSDQSRRMGSSSAGAIPGKQSASNPTEASTVMKTSRPSRLSGLERRLYTLSPQGFVSYGLDPTASQGRQPQDQPSSAQHQVPLAQTHTDRSPNPQEYPSPMQAGAPPSQQLPADTPAFARDGSGNMQRLSSPGLFVDQSNDNPTPAHAVDASESQYGERRTQSASTDDPKKKDISRFDEQPQKNRIQLLGGWMIDPDKGQGVQLYEHTEDYDDGDEDYTPTKGKGKMRASGQGCNKSKNETSPKDPSVSMGVDFLSKMPLEVRRRIYRQLLKANTTIAVMHGWSQAYRGQQLDVHVSILGVSKRHNTDANAVLYGENVFRYILRDDAQMVDFEVGKNQNELTLPLNKQIDNLRCLELEIEPNRIDITVCMAFYSALEILVKHKVTKLLRLTIDLSPRLQKGPPNKKGVSKDWVSQRVWFTKSQGITDMLKRLKAHFVYFDIHLEENNQSRATSLSTMVDMRPDISGGDMAAELSKHSAKVKATRPLEARRALARESIEERLEAEAYKKLDLMNTRLEQAVLKGAPHMLQRGWFVELKTERKQRKTYHAGDDAAEDE